MAAPTITLTKDQEAANNAFLDFLVSDENFFIIQGAAGTGKSFLVRHLLDTFYSRYKAYCLLLQKDVKQFDVKITATTNKAVSVLEDFLQDFLATRPDIKICTIYSLLGIRVTNDRKTGKTSLTFNQNQVPQFRTDGSVLPLVFIDEYSFFGQELQDIMESVLVKGAKAKIVYIGDKYQLSPVGQTASAVESLQCTRAELDEVVRNSGHILHTGTQFRRSVETGLFMPIQYNGQDVLHCNGPEFQQRVEASFGDPEWDPSKSRILAWTNERVHEYNKHVRKYLHLPEMFQTGEAVITNEFIGGAGSYHKTVDSWVRITRVIKDPITQYNIDGYMVELDHSHVGFLPNNPKKVQALLKSLAKEKNWTAFFDIKENWLDLRPIYASSIHKAQGSTYETVFLDLSDIGKNWNASDVARLLYVGITRASKQVVCYGYLPDRYC